ncbi:Fe-S cluster assembly protein SufD [Microbaculum sp. FT89]|uniref:Fe-S cluster assembly protein SufD n=1 Tax=Microbaculum sp. FT89 TaxID=3447298 RepID=UPI003F53DC36
MNVEVRNKQTAAEQAASEQFDAVAAMLPGTEAVAAVRKQAIARFAASGLPHRRVEEWKYTDLRAALRELPPPATASDAPIGADTLGELDAWRIVIVDGGEPRLPKELADQGVVVSRLSETLAAGTLEGEWPEGTGSAIFDLNTAFVSTGVGIRVPENVHIDKPIQIACVTTVPTAASIYLRNRVDVGAGGSLTVVETFEGPDGIGYLVNSATRLSADRDAALTWVKVQHDGDAAMHFSTVAADVGQGSKLTMAPFTTGAALSRNQFAIAFIGEHAEVNLAGVQLLGDRQHGDTTLFVDHALPDGESRELFKSVLDEQARGVFQGKILVRQDAQKTDGRMMMQALMLSDQAEVDSKPELEIYADDVQCGHGSTSGRIDEDLLFYLRARGIPELTAKALLIEAFVGEVVEEIGHAAVGEALSSLAHDWVMQHARQEPVS